MTGIYAEGKLFENIDFNKTELPIGDYENCTFSNCDFSNGDLSSFVFTNCKFLTCNLSLVKTTNTTFNTLFFKGCKILGVHFETCNDFLFSVRFENCVLNHSSFYKKNVKKTLFMNCGLLEVDFTETDLTTSLFSNCDLKGAMFDKTILEGADFRNAYNYSINPANNRLKKAKFSLSGVNGLLHHFGLEIDE